MSGHAQRPRAAGLDRRRFVGASLGALAAAPRLVRRPRLARSSDELRVAVVGLHGRGARHLAALRALPDVRVVALCDVDDQMVAREMRRMREKARSVGSVVDFRHLLDRDDVDALVLATPNHWHALQTIWACQAGKDVLVESPVTHFFAEGARVCSAASQHGRVVQSGLQARSSPALSAAIEWVRAQNLGPIDLVRALAYEARPSIGATKENRKVPEIVDYDMWCGPAPLVPLRRANLHHDWRWDYRYGDGELGNDAAHALDVARWVLGTDELPESVQSVGGRMGYTDDGETPNTQLVHYAFRPVPLLLEIRGLPANAEAQAADWSAAMDDYLGVRSGVIVHCAGGTLRIHLDGASLEGARAKEASSEGVAAEEGTADDSTAEEAAMRASDHALAIAYDDEGKEIRRWDEAGDPLALWVRACRSRKPEDLTAGIEVGARSSALVHLGNASQRVGRALARDALLEEVASTDMLAATCKRMLAHLDQNGVDLLEKPLVLGPRLVLDRERGVFPEHGRASALLAGSHREPFVLPGS